MARAFNYIFSRWWLFFLRTLFHFRVEGAEHLPQEGGALIISNHPSYFDPPILVDICQMSVGRHCALMAWDKLFGLPVASWVMRFYQAFPVDVNNPGRGPYELLLRKLRGGGLAGIFPEGGRSREDLMGAWKPGALRAAASADCVIVPVTIFGARDVWPVGSAVPRPFRRIHVKVHPPRKIDDMLSPAERESPLKVKLKIVEEKMRAEINAPMAEALLERSKQMCDRFDAASTHDVHGMGSARLAQRYRKRARELKLLQKQPK